MCVCVLLQTKCCRTQSIVMSSSLLLHSGRICVPNVWLFREGHQTLFMLSVLRPF